MSTLKVGSKLPELEGVDQNGNKVNFKDLYGKPTVIYFYPMDNTPGCTKEACSFRDNKRMFEGINVIGVSVQSAESHQRFFIKYSLNFTLVADSDKKISKAFGVLKLTGLDSRVTFIFDKDGVLKYVYDKVDPEGHAEEVLVKIKELGLI
ncbi:MAG: peroxiredoxin [Nitrososphaeria archaeon]|jgi:peroxiredoxin Q/BCP